MCSWKWPVLTVQYWYRTANQVPSALTHRQKLDVWDGWPFLATDDCTETAVLETWAIVRICHPKFIYLQEWTFDCVIMQNTCHSLVIVNAFTPIYFISWQLFEYIQNWLNAVVCSTSWKSVLLGAAVSQDREEWCIQSALKLCNNLTDGNVKALERVSLIKIYSFLMLPVSN